MSPHGHRADRVPQLWPTTPSITRSRGAAFPFVAPRRRRAPRSSGRRRRRPPLPADLARDDLGAPALPRDAQTRLPCSPRHAHGGTPFRWLLVVPAGALDLLVQRFGPGRDWRPRGAGGVTSRRCLRYPWFFTEFLSGTRAPSRSEVDQWDYSSRVGPWRYRFWRIAADPVTASGLAWGAVLPIVSAVSRAVVGELGWREAAVKVSVRTPLRDRRDRARRLRPRGSPDTYFEGRRRPIPVRVIVRTPRSPCLGSRRFHGPPARPRAVRRVLVLPGVLDPRPRAPAAGRRRRVPGGLDALQRGAVAHASADPYSVQVRLRGSKGAAPFWCR